MKKKIFVDYDYQTKTIFRMSLAFVTFLNLPFFLINDNKIILCRCLLVFLCSHIFYLFVFDKTLIQINLLLMLRHPLFIDYFSFVNKKTCFLNSSFRIFVFFVFCSFFFFWAKHNFFFFMSAKLFWTFFILPYLGYGFMLKINQKKVDLLAEKGCVSNFPLFSNTSLLENKQFYRNVQNWADLVSILKPSIDSSKKLSLITTPTSFFWILYPTLKKKGSVMITMSLSNIEDIELKTFPILHNKNVTIPQDWLLKKLAFWITEHARLLNETVKRYQEMNPLIRGLYFTLNPEEAKTLLAYSFKLLGDSRELAYCFQTKLECQYSHEVLIDLTKKYLPEFLPEVTQNLSVIPQNFGTENGNHVLQKNGGEITESHHIEKKIFTSKEDSLEFLGVLKKFFFF